MRVCVCFMVDIYFISKTLFKHSALKEYKVKGHSGKQETALLKVGATVTVCNAEDKLSIFFLEK